MLRPSFAQGTWPAEVDESFLTDLAHYHYHIPRACADWAGPEDGDLAKTLLSRAVLQLRSKLPALDEASNLYLAVRERHHGRVAQLLGPRLATAPDSSASASTSAGAHPCTALASFICVTEGEFREQLSDVLQSAGLKEMLADPIITAPTWCAWLGGSRTIGMRPASQAGVCAASDACAEQQLL